jgi:hypothetical protein
MFVKKKKKKKKKGRKLYQRVALIKNLQASLENIYIHIINNGFKSRQRTKPSFFDSSVQSRACLTSNNYS